MPDCGYDTEFEKLAALIAQASILCGYRNLIIHGLWVKTDDSEIAELTETRVGKNSLVRETIQYNNKEYLEWLVIAVTKLSFELYELGEQLSLVDRGDVRSP